jgi:crossover junction endonuclease MUS81
MDLPGAADQPQYPYLETDDPQSHARYPSTRPLADEDDDSDLGVVPATSLPFPQAVVKRTQVNPLEALNNAVGRSELLGGRAGLDAHTIGLSVSREVAKPTSSAGKFGFWYLGMSITLRLRSADISDAAGARVQMMSDAFIKLDPETFTILRKLAFEPMQITHPFVKQLKDVKLQGELYIGFISEDCAPPKCSGFLQGTSSVTTIAAKASGYLDHMSTSSAAGPSSEFSRTVSAPLPPRAGSPRAAAAMTAEARKLPVSLSRSTSASAAVPALPRTSGPRMTAHPEAPSALFQYDPTIAAPIPSHQPLAQSDFSPDKAIIFPPGSYEIVLVLDSRENENFFGRERCSDLLRARGVEVDVRALRIGDMCWVARRIDGGVGGENDECVLDYVVERKRLDDLLSSLTDGRYHEQKVGVTLVLDN